MTDRCHFCGLTGPEITVRDGKTEAFRDWFRPYGPGGALICHPCGSAPERNTETESAMGAMFSAASSVSDIGSVVLGRSGPDPLMAEDTPALDEMEIAFVIPADTEPGEPT